MICRNDIVNDRIAVTLRKDLPKPCRVKLNTGKGEEVVMFCGKCGEAIADNAAACPKCGTPVAGQTVAGPTVAVANGNATNIPNYLVGAILATLFCCLPFGIPAIIFATQVNSKIAAGDIDGAMKASKNAKTWTFVSVGAGLLATVFWILISVIAAAAN